MLLVYLYILIKLPYAIWQMINTIKDIKREVEKYNLSKDSKLYDWKKER